MDVPGVRQKVRLAVEDSIAVVTIDNPPLNVLNQKVRAGLQDVMLRCAADEEVSAVVLCCAGHSFSAGADMTEFGSRLEPPALTDLISQIEAMPKPVIAAIRGRALGGGLELTLGCHARIATADALLGQPEVKLGLIPGAGGTQRLPRLIGAEEALAAIVSGEPLDAHRALALGLLDAIAATNLQAEAISLARNIVSDGKPLRRTGMLEDKLAPSRADRSRFEAAAGALTGRQLRLIAPKACVEAVSFALDLPLSTALERERSLFLELMAGDQSKAQRHIFFAERQAAKIQDLPADVGPRQIRQVAVLGAGTMGSGIAMCLANAGMAVKLIDVEQGALARGIDQIAETWRRSAARGRILDHELESRMALIEGYVEIEAAADTDLVIEAVFEDLALKKRIMADLDRLMGPKALLATNTSTLDVNAIAASTSRPESVIGMHFFSPAHIMRLLEVIRGEKTGHEVLATVMAFGRQIGKVTVVSGVCDGFIGNRMMHKRTAQAERLVLEGARPRDVDAVLTAFGMPMGPFAMGDLTGLDVGWRIRRQRGTKAPVQDALYEFGWYGQKTGRGYYRYEEGSRKPIPDPEVEALISAISADLGIPQRTISKNEILERLIYVVINEGARILDEAIARSPGDIDVVWVYGFGWPVWRGGPMYYADGIGLAEIKDCLEHYARGTGDSALKPAPLLVRLAEERRTFASLETSSAGSGA